MNIEQKVNAIMRYIVADSQEEKDKIMEEIRMPRHMPRSQTLAGRIAEGKCCKKRIRKEPLQQIPAAIDKP